MRALLVLAMLVSTGCSTLKDVRASRVFHATATTYDLSAAVSQVSKGHFEANQAVTNVWPAVILTFVPWLVAEWLEDQGEPTWAAIAHWTAGTIQVAAGTYSLTVKE